MLFGEGNGDVVVAVLDQLLAKEDERLCCRKNADMLQIKDGRKLLDEAVGCLGLIDDDEVIHVAQNSKLTTNPDTTIGPQLAKMQLRQSCSEMLLPQFGSSAKTTKGLVETPDDVGVLDELTR